MVKKDITPTDAPKDIWPFLADSETAQWEESARRIFTLGKGFHLALFLELLIRLFFFNAISERTVARGWLLINIFVTVQFFMF